jgi:hypothetical protein
MAKRLNQRELLSLKLEALTDSEVQELLEYVGIMESMRRSKTVPAAWEDEVLAILADAHENRKAQQAFEWEAVRRRAEARAASRPSIRQ